MAKYDFYVDDVKMGQEELLTALGIDRSFIPQNRQKDFEINPDKVTKDSNGNPIVPPRLGVSTRFKAWSKASGSYLDVRIATSKEKENDSPNARTIYKPHQVWFEGRYKSGTDPQEFIWLLINPDNEDSPFRKEGSRWRYRFVNAEKSATNKIKMIELTTKATALIVGEHALTISQLRQIAKGMNLGNVNDLTGDQVRELLLDKIAINPIKFYEDCKDRNVLFNGKIQDAIDNGVLNINTESGLRRWFFQNEELTIIPSSSDSVKIVRDYVAERIHDLYPKIVYALENKSSNQVLNDKSTDVYFDEFDITKRDTPPSPAGSEVVNATKAALEEQQRLDKLNKYTDIHDLPPAEYESIHAGTRKAVEARKEEILKHRETEVYKEYLDSKAVTT